MTAEGKRKPRRVIASSLRKVWGNPDKVTEELADRNYELALREGSRQALADRRRPPAARPSRSPR